MNIAVNPSLESRKPAGLIVIPFWKGKSKAEEAADLSTFKDLLSQPLSTKDFLGKEGEFSIHYVPGQPEERFGLIGLGDREGLTAEKLRKIYAHVTRFCLKKKVGEINVLLPALTTISKKDLVKAIVDGLLMPNYNFTALKRHSLKEDDGVVLTKITLIGATRSELAIAQRCATLCESVNMVRDLSNGNADDVTPQYLAAVARGLAQTNKSIKTTIFDKKRIEKEKMGLLLAVNRGSAHDPAFIIVEYKGNPKSSDHTVLVGKGITFDTGGLNLKPTGGMEDMKADMTGGATVLGILHAVAALDLKINVTGVIPSTENGIDARSYKPGDVYVGYAGKSVEIMNTDAEGRLVLADALAYSVDKLKPTRIIDLATLTGAIEIALGPDITGLFSNNDVLADLLTGIGSDTGEKVWRMPLYEDYREYLKSDFADIKSTGGRPGSAIKAALFLQEFVGKTPWVHLDIAGTGYLAETRRFFPKYATGVGVRLIVALLENL